MATKKAARKTAKRVKAKKLADRELDKVSGGQPVTCGPIANRRCDMKDCCKNYNDSWFAARCRATQGYKYCGKFVRK